MEVPTVPKDIERDLQAFDQGCRVRWHPSQRCWVLEEYLPHFGRWNYVAPWQYPDGSFRPLPTSAEPLIRMLHEKDWSRRGDSLYAHKNFKTAGENRRKEFKRNREAKWAEIREEFLRDAAERAIGVRQTFGPDGPPRSRQHAAVGSHEMREEARKLAEEYKQTREK